MANQMTPDEMRETAKRLREGRFPEQGAWRTSDIEAGAEGLDRLADALEASPKRALLSSCRVPDHSEDDCPDEQDDADDREPDEALDRETDHGQHGPDDEKDDQHGPHVGNHTAVRAGTEQSEMRGRAEELRESAAIADESNLVEHAANQRAGADALDRLADVIEWALTDDTPPSLDSESYGIARGDALYIARGDTTTEKEKR